MIRQISNSLGFGTYYLTIFKNFQKIFKKLKKNKFFLKVTQQLRLDKMLIEEGIVRRKGSTLFFGAQKSVKKKS